MKKSMVFLLIVVTTSLAVPAFAGHDHGGGGSSGGSSHDSSGHAESSGRASEQASIAADQLLKECSQHLDGIQRQIGRLQAQLVDGKAATSAINGELEQLEQHLKEAKDLARSLRVF